MNIEGAQAMEDCLNNSVVRNNLQSSVLLSVLGQIITLFCNVAGRQGNTPTFFQSWTPEALTP